MTIVYFVDPRLKPSGDAEEHLFKHIKATEYQAGISKANGRDLEGILYQSMQFVLHEAAYQDFGDVGKRFVKAYRSILRAEPSSRLSGIIRKFFEYHNKAGLL